MFILSFSNDAQRPYTRNSRYTPLPMVVSISPFNMKYWTSKTSINSEFVKPNQFHSIQLRRSIAFSIAEDQSLQLIYLKIGVSDDLHKESSRHR